MSRLPRPAAPGKVLVLACGALAREVAAVIDLNGWSHVSLECLPANLHHRPKDIPAAVANRLDRVVDSYDEILIGYGDCGTGGELDRLLVERGLTRLPGSHCYEFFATTPNFLAMHEAELGTFYLTDFLVRHFDRFVWRYLGLDRHPELRDMYFGNYSRLVYLSQIDEPVLVDLARQAADRIGLRFEHVVTGYGDLETSVLEIASVSS